MKVYVLASWNPALNFETDSEQDIDVNIEGIYRTKESARQAIIFCEEIEYKTLDKDAMETILDGDHRFILYEDEPGYENPDAPILPWSAVLVALNNELDDKIVSGLFKSYEIFKRYV